MGQYTEALETTIRQQVGKGKSIEEAYAFIMDKLHGVMKCYEAGTNELLGIGSGGGIIDPKQQAMSRKFEEVRLVMADMIRDLDLLKK